MVGLVEDIFEPQAQFIGGFLDLLVDEDFGVVVFADDGLGQNGGIAFDQTKPYFLVCRDDQQIVLECGHLPALRFDSEFDQQCERHDG